MADDSIKIKLAVDKARNRVLFADAGSDFVDVLLSFLTLPLSAVRLVAGASSPGCLSTLCQGVSYLRESNLLWSDACHDMLLRPLHADEFGRIWCLKHGKPSCGCYPAIVKSEPSLQGHGPYCRCWQVMARVAHLFNRNEGSTATKFVDRKQGFVISDDLVIKPASTANSHLLLQRVGSGSIEHTFDFEEMEVCVGWTEVVSMLMACFWSKTVFTDTFLVHSFGSYVVEDDLFIYQASAVRVMKHWRNRGTDRVLQMDIAISKQEAVDLLRAALTCKTALTDVFKSKLDG